MPGGNLLSVPVLKGAIGAAPAIKWATGRGGVLATIALVYRLRINAGASSVGPGQRSLAWVLLVGTLAFAACSLTATRIAFAEPNVPFGALIHQSRLYVLFTAENRENFDVQCNFNVRAEYVDGTGQKIGFRQVQANTVVRARDLRFQEEAGQQTITALSAQWSTPTISELGVATKECNETINFHGPTFDFVGMMKNGLPEGRGTMTLRSGATVSGTWTGGKKNGDFHEKNDDGSPHFDGKYEDDVRNGPGKLHLSDQSTFEGNFLNNRYNGKGTFTYSNGSKYVGDYVNNVMSGYGRFYDSDGKLQYEGQYKDDVRQGQGTRYLSSGKWVGTFAEGTFNGPGTFHFTDGRRSVGTWKAGKADGYYVDFNSDESIRKGFVEDGKLVRSVITHAKGVLLSSNSFEICNRKSESFKIAIGSQLSGKWYAKGWYEVEGGNCIKPDFSGDGSGSIYLYMVESSGLSTAIPVGEKSTFCVDDRDPFELPDEYCSSSVPFHPDLQIKTFGKVPQTTGTYSFN
jgi:hypothetical protein